MQKQTVLEVYRKITQRIEIFEKRILNEGLHSKEYTLEEMINELNWIRAELEITNEVNPN